SKDSSLSILQQYASKDKRIKVFTQENQGPATARNVGLKNAKGEYIWFVDADDWCEPIAAMTAYEKIKKINADIIIFAARSYDDQKKEFAGTDRFGHNNQHIWLLDMIPNQYNNKLFIFEEAREWMLNVPMELWNRLYKRDFLTKHDIWLHTDLLMGDDCFLNVECYVSGAKIVILKDILYNYRIDIKTSVVSKLTYFKCKYYDYSLIMAKKTNSLIRKNNINPNTSKYLIKRDFSRIHAHYKMLKNLNKLKFHIKLRELLIEQKDLYTDEVLKFASNFDLINKIRNMSYVRYFFENYMIIKNKSQNNKTSYSIFCIPIITKKTEINRKAIYLFGIEIFKKKIMQDKIKKYFLGICYANKHKPVLELNLTNELRVLKDYISLQISATSLHKEVFPQFKNTNNGKDVVVVGSGPTLKYYKPIKNAVHIGVNRTFLYDKYKLDYLFLQDYIGAKHYIDAANKYLQGKCIKFYGITTFENITIPEQYAVKAEALRYFEGSFTTPFFSDISISPLPSYHSVIFPALSFAAYTNPKRIYIVGCDCNNLGNFDNFQGEYELSIPIVKNGWRDFKQFVKQMYPNTEVISVNPVGLKGLFKNEIYTKEFLEEN
ncbi:MAG: glycosyltransferase, partial [Campylobacteraceae bacterium]|nr:glycosyltransferase [Campylobacteraceae bacterium]